MLFRSYAQQFGGEFSVVALAWLDWQLKGDKKAAEMFKGDSPTLASREKWVIEKNELIDK